MTVDLDEGLTVNLDDDLTDDHSPVAAPRLRRRRRGADRRPPLPRMRHRPPQTQVNFYPDVAAFVTGFLAEVYAHDWHEQDTSWRWCGQWWLHTEALVRLEAIWKAWEVLRLDPGTGASVWLRDHADPAINTLTSPVGPFARCTPVKHTTPPALVTAAPPAGLFLGLPPAIPPAADVTHRLGPASQLPATTSGRSAPHHTNEEEVPHG